MRLPAIALMLAVAGCALPVPVIVGGLGLATWIFHFDDDVFNAWAAARGARVMPVDLPPVMVMVPAG